MITLNNYEEYFLLLADKELAPAEEAQVRAFAAQHPHLQEELELLMTCRLDATDIPAFPKEKLLRTTTWDVNNPEPIHTQLISLLDNELPAVQKTALQRQIAASPALQTEWNILQQTKLPVEAIAHPDKDSLYRRHKIRPLVWMRWAAAAVFAIGLLFWPKDNNITLPAGAVAAISALPSASSTAQPTNQSTKETVITQQPDNSAVATLTPTQQTQKATPQKQPENAQTEIVAINKKEENVVITKKKNNPVLKDEVVTPDPKIVASNESDIVTLGNNNSLTATLSEPGNVTLQPAQFTAKNIEPVSAMAPTTMAVNTLVTDEEEEYVHIAGTRIDKHKMRGLFRGITRSVARTFSKSKMKPAETAYATRN